MHVMRGASDQFDDETSENLMQQSGYSWPHAFARMEATADEILDVDYDGFGSAGKAYAGNP